jgi:hypothetical protein
MVRRRHQASRQLKAKKRKEKVVAELQRTEVLCIPKRRRLVHNRVKGTEGQDILHVFYGDREIIFDEPELLPFGDKLLQTERFRAEEAMSWSNGAPHPWDKVREMLEALIEQDILKRVTEVTAPPTAQTFPETLGEVPPGRTPRTFSALRDECEAITLETYGRAVDMSNLEAVVPVYRVAHPALDQDNRQVGEQNVNPRTLFLDLPTQRRVCNYAGSRCQADLPMNVTALKHMTKRWPELLSLTEQFRTAFFERLPLLGPSLRTGEVHLLTVASLASTAYVMVRGVDPVENGKLDPGLAAMFRLIDGVRLVTTELMRTTARQHGCDRPLDAQGVADYAERYAVYYGVHGVCAGPQALIDEYLKVLLDGGRAPIQVEPDVRARLGDLDAALDYGLHGQRIESLIRIFGASQGIGHQRLRAAFESHAPRCRLQDLFDAPVDAAHYTLLREDHPLLDTYELELQVNRWLFERSGAGLPAGAQGLPANGGQTFRGSRGFSGPLPRNASGMTDSRSCPQRTADDALKLDPAAQASGRRRLAEFFAGVLPDDTPLPERLRNELVEVAADVLALERRCLRAVRAEQALLNERLRRPQGRPLTGADLALYNRPRTGPILEVTLAEGLGLSITTDAACTVLRRGDRSVSLTD